MATRSNNCLCRNRKPVVRRLRRERAVRSLDSIFVHRSVNTISTCIHPGRLLLGGQSGTRPRRRCSRNLCSRRSLSRNALSAVFNPRRNSRAGLAGVQRHPRQRPLGEALRHQTGRFDQPRGSLRRGMEEWLKDLHASPQWAGACPVLCAAAQRQRCLLVVPTMLTWPHSAVVTDLKREIYELTAWLASNRGPEPYIAL